MSDAFQNVQLGGVEKNLLLNDIHAIKNDNLDDSSLRQLGESQAGLQKAGKAFEGVFLSMLLREMRNTTHPEDGLFEQSSAMQIFQDMQDDQITKEMASHSGLGVTEKIMETYGRHLKGVKSDARTGLSILDKVA